MATVVPSVKFYQGMNDLTEVKYPKNF